MSYAPPHRAGMAASAVTGMAAGLLVLATVRPARAA
ncbi:hypothetical protein HD596_002562 [Nonomuraea jabiensis]|uniref:Uncharacterized protein n=1 Tax=Nonomuraea jabiensis TaxID=882448 RepID=A0A7W9G293_9ACTN|nr:hypothetical protein [Nonomuraea jabiensis]